MDIRCLAVGVIGTLSQNNIQVQEDLFKKGVVDKLASIALTNDSYVLSAKVFYFWILHILYFLLKKMALSLC